MSQKNNRYTKFINIYYYFSTFVHFDFKSDNVSSFDGV